MIEMEWQPLHPGWEYELHSAAKLHSPSEKIQQQHIGPKAKKNTLQTGHLTEHFMEN